MAYGYIKGAEIASLLYYEGLMARTPDIEEREKIQGIINELERAIKATENQSIRIGASDLLQPSFTNCPGRSSQ
jgi:hypothetical protein